MLANNVMNADDVARYLHLGRNKVYQLAKSGELASYRVGRKLRFTIEDVEAYVASTHNAYADHAPKRIQSTSTASAPVRDLSDAAAFGELGGDPFVLAGGDFVGDIIASHLNAAGQRTERLLHGSYTSLVNLYAGDADAAIVHLYDQTSNSYNIPYVRDLAPGSSVKVFRICGRRQGFIVKRGNPKRLTTWGSILKEGVRLSNRAKGSGARVLLDEKLRAMEARSDLISGYDSVAQTAQVAVNRVASDLADVTIGCERDAMRNPNVEFVPLQTEWVDLVVTKSPRMRPLIRQIASVLPSKELAHDIQALQPCDVSKLGTIVYES